MYDSNTTNGNGTPMIEDIHKVSMDIIRIYQPLQAKATKETKLAHFGSLVWIPQGWLDIIPLQSSRPPPASHPCWADSNLPCQLKTVLHSQHAYEVWVWWEYKLHLESFRYLPFRERLRGHTSWKESKTTHPQCSSIGKTTTKDQWPMAQIEKAQLKMRNTVQGVILNAGCWSHSIVQWT